MTVYRLFAATSLLIAAAGLAACGKPKAEPIKATIGHHVTGLSVKVGSIWGGGYSVDVAPEEYVVVEHASCPNAKKVGAVGNRADGLCVVRISKDQTDRFAAAMEPFKRNAIPLETLSVEDPYVRPDGKPCRNEVTDSALISLTWAGTGGVKIATFYTGCDREEFETVYKSVLSVTDPLPIQQIIRKP